MHCWGKEVRQAAPSLPLLSGTARSCSGKPTAMIPIAWLARTAACGARGQQRRGMPPDLPAHWRMWRAALWPPGRWASLFQCQPCFVALYECTTCFAQKLGLQDSMGLKVTPSRLAYIGGGGGVQTPPELSIAGWEWLGRGVRS